LTGGFFSARLDIAVAWSAAQGFGGNARREWRGWRVAPRHREGNGARTSDLERGARAVGEERARGAERRTLDRTTAAARRRLL
jgi:hypothetical protein